MAKQPTPQGIPAEINESCPSWITAGRGFADMYLAFCHRPKGHTEGPDLNRREHYDPDHNLRWAE